MDRPRLALLAFALLAALTACGPAPDPAAGTSTPPPADTPQPTPEPTPPPPVPTNTIPARFHGEWNQVLADCGTGNNDTRLRLAGDSVNFYEAGGPVVQATEEGNDLQVTVQLTGEGVTVERRYAWRLSSDGQSLQDLGDGGLVRLRCAT